MTDRVAVVGAGQMGNGIAHVFAQYGFPVTMIDVSQDALDKGRSTIARNVERQVKKGTIAAEDQVKILARVDLSMELEAAAESALVIEAASEESPTRFWRRTPARSRSPRSRVALRVRTKSSACTS